MIITIKLLGKGWIMTALDRLAQQIDNLLHERRTLKAENQRLKRQIEILTKSEETIANLENEKRQQNREIIELSKRLERLIHL